MNPQEILGILGLITVISLLSLLGLSFSHVLRQRCIDELRRAGVPDEKIEKAIMEANIYAQNGWTWKC